MFPPERTLNAQKNSEQLLSPIVIGLGDGDNNLYTEVPALEPMFAMLPTEFAVGIPMIKDTPTPISI